MRSTKNVHQILVSLSVILNLKNKPRDKSGFCFSIKRNTFQIPQGVGWYLNVRLLYVLRQYKLQ